MMIEIILWVCGSIIIGLSFMLVGGMAVYATIDLDSDLMTIYPDPGQPITILEDKSD